MIKKLLFFFFLLGTLIRVNAQENLFDLEHSRKFAAYLLESGQYENATREYERVLFLDGNDENAKLNLLKSYRLSTKYLDGIQRAYSLYDSVQAMPRSHALEFSKLMLNAEKDAQAKTFWDESKSLTSDDKRLLTSTVYMFDYEFLKAQQALAEMANTSNPLYQNYISIIDQASSEHMKKPFVAGFLSTMVPGLGKVYTGDWKDGIVSFIFTAGMGFQAYRKFSKFGVNNYRPWVYTAIGSGFYLGGIYGSVKSAKNKNRKKLNLLLHEASDSFNAYY